MRQPLITLMSVFGLSAIANASIYYTDPLDEPEPKYTRIAHCKEYGGTGRYYSKFISHDGGPEKKRCPDDFYYIGCEYDYDAEDYIEYTKETCSRQASRPPRPPITRRPPPPPTTRRPPPPPPTTRPPPPPSPPCERNISCGYFRKKYRGSKPATFGYFSEYYCPPKYGSRSPCTSPYYYRRCEHDDYDDSYYEHPRKFCNVGEFVPPTDPPRRRCVRRRKKKSGSSSSGKSSKKSSSSKSSKSSKSSSSGSSSGTTSGTTSCTTSSGTSSSGSSSGSSSD